MNLEEPIEVPPVELKEKLRLSKETRTVVIDVREPDEFNEWRLEGSTNVPLGVVESQSDARDLSRDLRVVTVCRTGVRSLRAAQVLREQGINARSLKGGLVAWSKTYDIAPLPSANIEGLRIVQIRRLGNGCISYVVAYLNECIGIDPSVHTDQLLHRLSSERFRISCVVDTHCHADHLSGARALARATGASLFLNSLEKYCFNDFAELEEGKSIQLGDGRISLRVIQTHGQTPGSVSLQVGNWLFSGDTLFLDGFARPDLHEMKEILVHDLYSTYQKKILGLPRDTLILPGHVRVFPQAQYGTPIMAPLTNLIAQLPLIQASEE